MITILFMFESLEHEVFFKAINGMLLKSLIMHFLATWTIEFVSVIP